jgi:hypothetical protein
VALTDDQVMVVEAPAAMDEDAKVSVGVAGGAATVKLAVLAVDVPNELVQLSEKVSVPPAAGVTVWLPLVGRVPLQPPDALQLVAPTEDQVMPVGWPRTMELVLNVSVGAAGAASVKVTELVAVAPAALAHTNV